MKKISLVLFATASCQLAAEPTFNHTQQNWDKLFSTEVKVDQKLPNGNQSGHDMFLRYGSTWEGASNNIDWLQHDGNGDLNWFKASFDWELSRDGTDTTFQFGDTTLNYTSTEGNWEGLGVWMNTSGYGWFFDNAWIDWTLTSWNNDHLDYPINYRSTLGQRNYFEVIDSDKFAINSVGGTVQFHWDLDNYYAHYYNKTPGSRLAFSLKGLDYSHIDLPLPGTPIDNPNDISDVSGPMNQVAIIGMMMLCFSGVFGGRAKQLLRKWRSPDTLSA